MIYQTPKGREVGGLALSCANPRAAGGEWVGGRTSRHIASCLAERSVHAAH